MADLMTSGGPACAHSRVRRHRVDSGHGDGTVCDEWRCEDCGTVFVERARLVATEARHHERVTALLDQNQAIAENVARMSAELAQLRPVYDAAVAWRQMDAASRGFGGKAELSALANAVDKLFETKGET